MIRATMAVAAAGPTLAPTADFARDARIPRAVAVLVDSLVFGVIGLVINNVYGVSHVTSGSPPQLGLPFASFSTSTTIAWPWLALLAVVYFAVPEAMFGATPGKRLMGLQVVRADGRRLEVRAILIRNLLRPIDYLPVLYLLGGVLVLVTANSQRLGDVAAGTTVVHRHRALAPGATRSSTIATRGALGAALAFAVVLTIAFNYFGRPPLVIAGLFNEHRLIRPDITVYSLGSPEWGVETITYPITLRTQYQACKGTIQLDWAAGGWELTSAQFLCPS